MKELINFNNPNFGEMRTILNEKNEPMFCLADVCKILEISNPRQVKTRLNPKGVQLIELQGVYNNDGVIINELGNTRANFINEANLYKCIFQSRKEQAEKFQDWVCEEVLPSLRKTGKYEIPNPNTVKTIGTLSMIQDIIETNKKALQMIEEYHKNQVAENKIPQIEQKKETHFSILGFCKKVGLDLKSGHRSTFGKRARKHCDENNIEYRSVDDARFGSVLAFPEEILPTVFNKINAEYNWGYDFKF